MEITQATRLEMRQRPKDSPFVYQEWRDLAFLHWAYDKEALQKTLPKGLFVDCYQGQGYVTVTPFFIQNVRLANMFTLPGLSNFVEVNLRTYVYDEYGIPGVWFYSLYLNSQFGASAARESFDLPYFAAELVGSKSNQISIKGKRAGAAHFEMEFNYTPEEKLATAATDSLDFFLLERYVMFTQTKAGLKSARVHHAPYPFMKTEVANWRYELFANSSLNNPERTPDLIHYSTGVDVDIFQMQTKQR